jgi:hypothetical protein
VPTQLWYVAYGSNMSARRLRYYLDGGRPPGAARTYPGCRDRAAPARDEPVMIPGGVYFALWSRAWGGGLALYDPALPGEAAARAYLVTVGQFSDIASQEMYREPVADLDLVDAVASGRHQFGPGRYETLLLVGERDGTPMLTFTAPWSAADVDWVPPEPAYLRLLGTGLAESHGWPPDRIGEYLAGLPGARGTWTAEAVTALLDAGRLD